MDYIVYELQLVTTDSFHFSLSFHADLSLRSSGKVLVSLPTVCPKGWKNVDITMLIFSKLACFSWRESHFCVLEGIEFIIPVIAANTI